MRSRFDDLSSSYEDLLRDPIRDRFTGADAAFFHLRKSILIRDYFHRRGIDTRTLSYLDVGCGKGELLSHLRHQFARVAGCDVSAEMMQAVQGIETRLQEHPLKIPYANQTFEFVTAVCVYHHVPLRHRIELTQEIARVLKPGGVLAIIEHNPFNPITRLIVSRTPVDADAILLTPREVQRLMAEAGLACVGKRFFLYFPERLFRVMGRAEDLLGSVPLGGQFAIFSSRPQSRGLSVKSR